MKEIYLRLRQRARAIAAELPLPEFYTKFSEEIIASENLFASTPVLVKIKKQIIPILENDFGHGVLHSVLVCRDAGAIVMIEMKNNLIAKNATPCFKTKSEIKENAGIKKCSNINMDFNIYTDSDIKKNMILIQIAGLLHDIKRKHKNHAQKGAEFAEKFLKTGYDLSSDDIYFVCNAIREHEAFKNNHGSSNAQLSKNTSYKNNAAHNGDYEDNKAGAIKMYHKEKNNLKTALFLSGALYDADKFRWGPDNFTHTVWDMVMFSDTPFEEFKKRYPSGMAKLAEIKDTFRTDTGRKYGPEFITLGIKIGEILSEFIWNKSI